mmetsp:Transcript_68678/g.149476  ORF Transcript_68678/g.149476 Transcript_68678/m.149476 type:complete len:307 (-) Transcript_68678:320-1240(-)
MASRRNDALQERSVVGTVNYYDDHRGCGTAADKGLAARLGGHNYNIISNDARHEIYFPELRNGDHFLDSKGRHTAHLFGPRQRRFAGDERGLMWECISAPDAHPREGAQWRFRTEVQLAQMENSGSYRAFREQLGDAPPLRRSIDSRGPRGQMPKSKPGQLGVTGREEWLCRSLNSITSTASEPDLREQEPPWNVSAVSAVSQRLSQRLTESAHPAHSRAVSSYAASMGSTALGRRLAADQRFCSLDRLENHDFSVARKNNHYSSQDRLTRSDPFFMRPRLGNTNNSVKYNIINNERRWYRYAAAG